MLLGGRWTFHSWYRDSTACDMSVSIVAHADPACGSTYAPWTGSPAISALRLDILKSLQ